MLTHRTRISFASKEKAKRIAVVQGDNGRSLRFDIEDYTIPNDAEAYVYIKKPSGATIYDTAEVGSRHVTFNLTAQCVAESGDNFGQVRITQNGEVITSFDFVLEVCPFRGITAVKSGTEMNIFDREIERAKRQIADSVDEFLKKTKPDMKVSLVGYRKEDGIELETVIDSFDNTFLCIPWQYDLWTDSTQRHNMACMFAVPPQFEGKWRFVYFFHRGNEIITVDRDNTPPGIPSNPEVHRAFWYRLMFGAKAETPVTSVRIGIEFYDENDNLVRTIYSAQINYTTISLDPFEEEITITETDPADYDDDVAWCGWLSKIYGGPAGWTVADTDTEPMPYFLSQLSNNVTALGMRPKAHVPYAGDDSFYNAFAIIRKGKNHIVSNPVNINAEEGG